MYLSHYVVQCCESIKITYLVVLRFKYIYFCVINVVISVIMSSAFVIAN